MADILLTVSGTIDPDVEQQVALGLRPMPDYLAMSRAFPADLIDYPRARATGGLFGKVLERLGGPNLMLAWACFVQRHKYRVIFTDGEQVGIPLALLAKAARSKPFRHITIGHRLSVRKKVVIFDLFKIQQQIDCIVVYSTWQKHFVEQRLKVEPEQVLFTPFMVDADFFSISRVTPQRRNMICAVGLEYRDYPTLIEAVGELDVEVVIAAASPWSKRSDSSSGVELPPNVTVRKFTQFELRQLYADSQFMVMPLYDVDFQAGVTAILEAMAMGRAVICSKTLGQQDTLIAGQTGVYVPPNHIAELRTAIKNLLTNSEHSIFLGTLGRMQVEAEYSLTRYAERLASKIDE